MEFLTGITSGRRVAAGGGVLPLWRFKSQAARMMQIRRNCKFATQYLLKLPFKNINMLKCSSEILLVWA